MTVIKPNALSNVTTFKWYFWRLLNGVSGLSELCVVPVVVVRCRRSACMHAVAWCIMCSV